jgi:hypothetical protein
MHVCMLWLLQGTVLLTLLRTAPLPIPSPCHPTDDLEDGSPLETCFILAKMQVRAGRVGTGQHHSISLLGNYCALYNQP